MAQRRLRDWQDPLGSYEHNLINLGVHYPGRFSGFDTLTPTGGLTFKIGHGGDGIRTWDEEGLPTGPFGVAMTAQGVILIEDADVLALAVDANPNAIDRYDQFVMTHQYQVSTGGFDAIYEIVKGDTATENLSPLAPFQVQLGIIRVPKGTVNATTLDYQKGVVPDSGDEVDAKLETVNEFEKTNLQAQSLDTPTNLDNTELTDNNNLNLIKGKRWSLNNKGNTFTIIAFTADAMDLIRLPKTNNQDGVEINLRADDKLTLQHNTPPSPAERLLGFAPIYIPDQWRDSVNNWYKPPTPGAQLLYTLLRASGIWWLKNAVGVGVNTGNSGNPGGGPKTAILNLSFIHASGFLSFSMALSTALDAPFSWDRAFADAYTDGTCSTGATASAQMNNGLVMPQGQIASSKSPEIVSAPWVTTPPILKARMYNVLINGVAITDGNTITIGSYAVTVHVPSCN